MLLSSELVGYLAAGLKTASFFPQAMKTLRSGDTKAISLGMYALFTSGVAMWSLNADERSAGQRRAGIG